MEQQINLFISIAKALPEVTEAPHFEKHAFKVKNKIFATLNQKEHRATVKLNPKDQDLFCLHDKNAVFPLPNKWGKSGWTHIQFEHVKDEVIEDILMAAYVEIAPPNLSKNLIDGIK